MSDVATKPKADAVQKAKYALRVLDEPSLFTSFINGRLVSVTAKALPILRGLSLQRLVLNTSAIREPHWYTNANALGYCLSGTASIKVFGNSDDCDEFTISKGEMFYIPASYMYHIENLTDSIQNISAEFVIALSHELPEHVDLSRVFGDMNDAVLDTTFQLPSNAWSNVVKHNEATVIGKRHTINQGGGQQGLLLTHEYKSNFGKAPKQLFNTEGSIQQVSKQSWPVLDGISMCLLRLSTTAMREPHWYRQTASMGYMVEGDARITITSATADQQSETHELKPGDMYFAPRAYPHYIENIGTVPVKILIFYDQSIADDIGITDIVSTCPREVLAAALQCEPNHVPIVQSNPPKKVIGHRINPVDQ